jgi:hypothetical protein
MGTVVKFKQALPKQSDESSGLSGQLRDYLSELAEKLQTIEAYTSAVDENLRVVQSIMRSSENPELRARLLGQLKDMHDQLLLVSLNLLSAKLSLQNEVGLN